jgi:transposase
MAIIGMDIHRAFAEVVALEGKSRRRLGRIVMRCDRLAAFAAGLTKDDIVVVEATGNATAVAEVLAPHVGRVVIANPKRVRVIAYAKIKTDKIDAAVLAELYASGFLPEVWIPDKDTLALRRQVATQSDRSTADAAKEHRAVDPACAPDPCICCWQYVWAQGSSLACCAKAARG